MISKKYFLLFAILSAKTVVYASEKSNSNKVEPVFTEYSFLESKVDHYPNIRHMVKINTVGYMFEYLELEKFTEHVMQATSRDRQRALKRAMVCYDEALKRCTNRQKDLNVLVNTKKQINPDDVIDASLCVALAHSSINSYKSIIDCLKQHGAKEEKQQ